MFKLLVDVLMQQASAQSPEDPVAWLQALQRAKWDSVNAQNGQITGTSVNGKSVYMTTLPGCSIADTLFASQYALRLIERGHSGPPGKTQAVLN